jgi:hypothetical protein
MGKRDQYGQHPYGVVHKKARQRFARRMRAGEVFWCWRPNCPTPDVPINPRYWDLGHVDPELHGEFGTRWPEHPKCNRATITHLKAERAAPAVTSPPARRSRVW